MKQPNYEALKKTCNLWRNWGDIDDSWASWLSIADYFSSNQDSIAQHAGPGHWNDPGNYFGYKNSINLLNPRHSDTLLLGNFGLSYDQSKAQLAVWAILAAPFLLSNDLRKIQPEIKELMLNRDVIAIDQDALGIQGRLISKSDNIETWARKVLPIVRGEYSYAIAFVSHRTDGHPFPFQVTLKLLHLGNRHGYEVKVKFFKFVYPYHDDKLSFSGFVRLKSSQFQIWPQRLNRSTRQPIRIKFLQVRSHINHKLFYQL